MYKLIAIALLASLSACSGLNTAWNFKFEADYLTPELRDELKKRAAQPAPKPIEPGKPA
jgi:hypothetical protein